MGDAETIGIEVAYALPRRQRVVGLRVAIGTTVAQALMRADLAREFPEIDPARAQCGIYGRRVALDHELRDGDRVEIYRPLIVDPKSLRRARAGERTVKAAPGKSAGVRS